MTVRSAELSDASKLILYISANARLKRMHTKGQERVADIG